MTKRRLLEKALTAEEIETLEALARYHPYGDFRLRGLGLLALDAGRGVAEICEILRISDQPLYNWAKAWREQGLMGILKGHQGGHSSEVDRANAGCGGTDCEGRVADVYR